jgi:hypothetical protein
MHEDCYLFRIAEKLNIENFDELIAATGRSQDG